MKGVPCPCWHSRSNASTSPFSTRATRSDSGPCPARNTRSPFGVRPKRRCSSSPTSRRRRGRGATHRRAAFTARGSSPSGPVQPCTSVRRRSCPALSWSRSSLVGIHSPTRQASSSDAHETDGSKLCDLKPSLGVTRMR